MGSDWRILCGGGAQTPLDLMRYHLKQKTAAIDKTQKREKKAKEKGSESGEGQGRRTGGKEIIEG